jgi:hypothetical protein
MDATVVMSAEVLGSPSLDLSDAHLAFGYVDSASVPTVQVFDVSTEAKVKGKWAVAPVAFAHYGSSYIRTSLAHQGERFGFGWYTERSTSLIAGGSGVWATSFATMNASSGSVSPADYASPERGRHDSRDLVLAIDPVVSATSDGFFVSWRDTRTAEPAVMGVNIAGWIGLYGQAFDASGQASGSDVQVAQTTFPSSVLGLHAGGKLSMLWSGNADGNDHFLAMRTVSGTSFTPAEAPSPFATFLSYDALEVAAAVGADGRTLVLTTYRDGAGSHLGSIVLGASGNVEQKLQAWPETGLRMPAVAATADGFVAVAVERGQNSTDGAAALRYFFLDASGQKISDARVALPSGNLANRALSVRVIAGRAMAAVALGPLTPKQDANHADVVLAGACPTAN